MKNSLPTLRALAAVALVLGTACVAHAAQQYRIQFITHPRPFVPYQRLRSVGGLNNLGEVAFEYSRTIVGPGYSRSVSDSFVATQTGIRAIPDIGGGDVHVNALTDAGLVVGSAASAGNTYPPENYNYELNSSEPIASHAGQTTPLPTPVGGYGFATAANNQNVVVGFEYITITSGTVLRWTDSTGYVDLGNFGRKLVAVDDVNERGDILLTLQNEEILQYGETYRYTGNDAIIVHGDSIISVPSSKYGITIGSAINDNGAVAGSFFTIPGVEVHAYVWDQAGGFRDLGADGEFSGATDINNAGVVIGYYGPKYGSGTPFVYTEKDGRHALSDLIVDAEDWFSLESATHINDRGQIAGIADTSAGRRVYIATPIPEPSTLAAALIFCICAANRMRSRRKTSPSPLKGP